MRFKHLTLTAAAALLSLGALAADPHADDAGYPEPRTIDYALLLPGNLPHVLRFAQMHADQLGLDAAQREVVQGLMVKAPTEVMGRLNEAQDLELDLAEQVLYRGAQLADIQPRLDQLSRLKQAATQAQIASINRLQALMSAQQFRQLIALAQGTPAAR